MQNNERIHDAWLRKNCRDSRRYVYLVVAAGFCNVLGLIAQSVLLAFTLHRVIIADAELRDVTHLLAGLFAVYCFRALCVYLSEVAGHAGAARVRRKVRRELMEKLVELGPAFTRQHHSGELASVAVEQIEALDGYVARYLPQRILVVLAPIAIIMAVLPVNWVVGVIFLITGPLIPLFMILIGMGAAAEKRRQFRALERMSGYFLDRLQGLTTLRLFGQAQHELSSIARVSDEFRQRTMKVLRIAFLSSAALEFFGAIGVALVAVYVGFGLLGLVSFGPASSTSLYQGLFVLLLAPEFFQPMRQLAVGYHERAAALGAAESIVKILEADKPNILERPDRAIAIDNPVSVEFKNVFKSYEEGQRPVLNGLDFELRPGEKLALVGSTGAGKTTIINLLLGFEQADSGAILVNGNNLSNLSPRSVRRSSAWVGQSPYIFHGSIHENIALGQPGADLARIEIAAEAARVNEFTDKLPAGLDTLVGERGYGLSGGQAQRIAIARAFLKDSQLLLLDEPTANLDRHNQALILLALEQLFGDRTVIVATHNPAVIAKTDRQLHISVGCATAKSNPVGCDYVV